MAFLGGLFVTAPGARLHLVPTDQPGATQALGLADAAAEPLGRACQESPSAPRLLMRNALPPDHRNCRCAVDLELLVREDLSRSIAEALDRSMMGGDVETKRRGKP